MTKRENEREAVNACLARCTDPHKADIKKMVGEILKETNQRFGIHNSACAKDEKWRKLEQITEEQAVLLLSSRYRFANIIPHGSDEREGELCMYMEDGPDKGVYIPAEKALPLVVDECLYTSKKGEEEICRHIAKHADTICQTLDGDLSVVNNGIFDYKSKTLRPFSPDYAFLHKCHTDYVDNAPLPVIRNPDGTDWDVESWIASLSDDPELVELLWMVLGAIVRPDAGWDKLVFLIGETAGNGKSTFCELCEALSGNTVRLSIQNFNDKFGLDDLIGASAVICAENKMLYLEDNAALKSAVIGESLRTDRKFKKCVTFKFSGLVVQASNELPRLKKPDSGFYRRFLPIPFVKSFQRNANPDIRRDYVKRKEVLEYVLHKVLHMNYNALSEPDACKALLREMTTQNDPVMQFVDDIFADLKWRFVPWSFLYDLYKSWMKAMNPCGKPLSHKMFTLRVQDLLSAGECDGWESSATPVTPNPNTNMQGPELLIQRYGLTDWMNPAYKGGDPDKICTPNPGMLKQSMRGITRV